MKDALEIAIKKCLQEQGYFVRTVILSGTWEENILEKKEFVSIRAEKND